MVADTEAKTAKRGRAKKGEGPYSIMFVDKENKDFSRLPDNVVFVKVAEKDGQAKKYPISSLSPQIVHALASEGLKRRLDAFMRNAVGGDKSAITLADEAYASIKDGKIYSRGENKGAGRTFDPTIWVDTMEELAKMKNASDPKKFPLAKKAQLEALKTKLESATPQQRKDMIAKWKNDPAFNIAKKKVDVVRASAKKVEGGDYNALSDF